MRLNYQRLKWDSSAIQRILHGDTTRGRRAKAQGESYTVPTPKEQ